MPKKYQDKTVCVMDDGIFISVAHRLAQDFGQVFYYTNWKSSFPSITDKSIGDGYDDFKRIDNLWNHYDEIDLFVFPGIMDGDLQLFLEKQGKLVWGSREGEMLEVDRWGFLQYLDKLGLNTPKSQLVTGLDELQEVLEKEDNLYIKTDSTNRGCFETFFHKTWNTTRPLIDRLRLEMGPLNANVKFIVQQPISGDLEYGFDTYMVNGEFPETIMYGFEIKDLGYVCKVLKFDEMEPEIVNIFDKLKDTFKEYKYTGNFSAEIRKDDDGKFYFTDACCRNPNPATFTMCNMLENFSEVIYEGSQGNLIQPVWSAKFGGEIMINSEFVKNNFGELFYPDDVRPFVNRSNCCMIDGVEWNIPNGHHARQLDQYGSVVSVDDDAKKMLDTLLERAKSIEGYKININPKNLDLALEKLTK